MAVETITRDDLGEVRVETGEGIVTVFEHEENRRNARVEIHATHTRLNYDLKAWADSQAPGLIENLRRAHDSGEVVAYRIEVKRRTGVDVERPLADLGNQEKVRDLVSVRPVGHEAPSAQEELPAAPPPDPVYMSSAEADAAEEARAKVNRGLEEAGRKSQEAAHARELAQATRAGHDPKDVITPTPAPSARGRRGPRIEEAKPWERYNSDGSLNLGSYEMQAAAGVTSLAYDLWLERLRRQAVDRGEPMASPDPANVKALARRLLHAADRAQAAVRTDGHSDRMDSSHSRARGAIRSALEAYPVPWGASKEVGEAWVDTLVEAAALILRIGTELLTEEESAG